MHDDGQSDPGEGLPNPAPVVTRNWGQLPRGRKWGTTAGIDVDLIDGNVWAYQRCGAATAAGGPVDCDNTPLDPIFKFDRKTGAVLANFGKGVMVTPHGIAVDMRGNVWIADFAGNKAYDRYFRRADETTGMPLVDPHPSSPHGAYCAAATPCLRRRRAIGPTVRRCAH